jgi:hypothetical protein
MPAAASMKPAIEAHQADSDFSRVQAAEKAGILGAILRQAQDEA